MMEFIVYDTSTPISMSEFEKIYSILTSSLPQTEMRHKKGQQALLKVEAYNLITVYENHNLIGFMAIWNLKECVYIEHFAVEKNFRGKGIGGKIIEYLKTMTHKPIILEVELPESSTEATRRINFYKRCGFHYNKYKYFQPALQEGFPLLPLRIMSYPAPLSSIEFTTLKNTLYTEIYGFLEKRLD